MADLFISLFIYILEWRWIYFLQANNFIVIIIIIIIIIIIVIIIIIIIIIIISLDVWLTRNKLVK